MKIGIDFHGVIDTYTEGFSRLCQKWRGEGHEIHIITGKEWAAVAKQLKEMSIPWDKYYSIIDYHQSIGTSMKLEEDGWWMDEQIWNKSKGEYCLRANIDLFLDNELRYAGNIPESCSFVLVRERNFEKILALFI